MIIIHHALLIPALSRIHITHVHLTYHRFSCRFYPPPVVSRYLPMCSHTSLRLFCFVSCISYVPAGHAAPTHSCRLFTEHSGSEHPVAYCSHLSEILMPLEIWPIPITLLFACYMPPHPSSCAWDTEMKSPCGTYMYPAKSCAA